ncbi:hypothetical protein BDZ89DRAFT_1239018 [Hymenopellis radicata]|nr:hypothetical protein BDZ89DRAFT_1239018 [Hymenopellis radicata]
MGKWASAFRISVVQKESETDPLECHAQEERLLEVMAKKRKERNDESEVSESDSDSGKVWVPKFLKGWLGGEARQYAYDNHVAEFCQLNAKSAHDGTAYATRASNEMMLLFGELGPWGADSKLLEQEMDDEDLVPYDAPETTQERGARKVRIILFNSKNTTQSPGAEGAGQSAEADGPSADASGVSQKRGGGHARGTKRKHSDDVQEESIQSKEARAYRRAHIERFRVSYTNWLRYRYKKDEEGDTARGRHKPGKAGKTSVKSSPSDTSGENLAVLMVHELLGLGRATVHVAHPFQLWAKDQPEEFRTRWLKRYKAAGKPRHGRAGAEMQYYAQKFHKCTEDVQQTYIDKCSALKEAAHANREKMSEMVNTRLDPERAAELLANIPFILDPFLTSLSNMLHAKVSFCMGVPDPTDGGRLVIRTLDRGENHDPIPVSFGKSPLFARHIDAFKEFLDDAYSPAELRACAIPGTVPKSPKKSVRSTDGQIVIVVQNMSIPAGENWAKRNSGGDESDDDSGNENEKRRRRRKAREERDRQREEDGGGERCGSKKKKSMPEKAAKKGRKKALPSTTRTSTASGSATLVDVSSSRGRKKAPPATSAHRKQLLSLAKQVPSPTGATDEDEQVTAQPQLRRLRRTGTPRPKPNFKKKDDRPQILEGIPEDDLVADSFSLDVDEFEAPTTRVDDADMDDFMDTFDFSPIIKPGENPFARTNVGLEGAGLDVRKKTVEATDRVTRSSQRNRVPPTGDKRIQAEASSSRPTIASRRGKPPSTRAAVAAPPSPPFNPFDKSGWSDCISWDDWQTMLNLWTRVEGLARFRLGKRRPWDLKKFATDFWRWWVHVQPAWRDVAGLDGPLTEEHRPDPAGRDWGELRQAKGRNGLASVIACLHWWGRHHTLTKGPDALGRQWREAVADVTYVLEGLLAAGWEA